jgi:hypothetical protein
MLWKLVGIVPVGVEQPPGDVAAQDHQRSSGGADVSGGHVVAAAGSGATRRAVQGVLEVAGHMALRPEAVQLIKFFRR